MDKVDYQILSYVQKNARISNSEIARQIGMVPSGVLERIKKLEENGYIQEYTARLNAESLNLGLLAFIFVQTTERPGSCCVSEDLAKLPEILEVHHVAGEDCYLLKIRLADNRALADFLREKIGNIPSVSSTRSVIVMDTIKETSKINVTEIKSRKTEKTNKKK
jgi:Lrp/AsnC family leucine-responsive transcriptional regulator